MAVFKRKLSNPGGPALQGEQGDALHAVLCATGYNLRWLLRAMLRLGLKGTFCARLYCC